MPQFLLKIPAISYFLKLPFLNIAFLYFHRFGQLAEHVAFKCYAFGRVIAQIVQVPFAIAPQAGMYHYGFVVPAH